jgi:uncharacterized protein
MNDKLDKLKSYIASLGSVAVGFSGGVDSALLMCVAHEVLGDKALAVTAVANSVPERELSEAKAFCERYGIRHIVSIVDPMTEDGYRNNTENRCYYCKRMIFAEIKRIADENGMSCVAEGSNTDDTGDYRPGLRAVAELGVKCPLREAGLAKADIRAISKELGLPTWDKPAYACLATRIAYGEEITEEKLRMIEQAEQFLIEHGFLQERVRMHGNLARIEVPAKDIPLLAGEEIREELYKRFKEIGFMYVTLDMRGYQMGSMNETLKK